MSATVTGRAFVFPADVDSPTTTQECEKLYELAAGRVCLELGCWKGRTAISMAQSAQTVHCVDHFRGDEHTGYALTLGDFLGNLTRYGVTRKVVTHVGSFDQILPVLKHDAFGLVFCDGLHTREATFEQAEWAKALVAPDGIIVFHDYAIEQENPLARDHGFNVTEVVDALGTPTVVDSLAILEASCLTG